MSESSKQILKKAGLPPGTLIHVGKRKSEKIKLSVIDYNETEFTETICKKPDECFRYRDKETISWINIDGLHDTEAIASIGNHYEMHPLILEDILNTHHRPKVEEFEHYLFITLKMLGLNKDATSIVSEQVSFILTRTTVISFQEREGDIFDGIRERLRSSKGNIRKMGVDYLLYRLVDTLVDHYFYVIESISEATEKLEEKVLQDVESDTINQIQNIKKQLLKVRKAVSPLREAISVLLKNDSQLIKESTLRYLRDVYEHIIHVNDSIETQRDILSGIKDLYLSILSNKMNQVMKVLTIIATIFIPLTFIAGIYGMNFDNMPELHWQYGYFLVWAIMAVIFVLMMLYFKGKKWL
jgi:magnesium transporter